MPAIHPAREYEPQEPERRTQHLDGSRLAYDEKQAILRAIVAEPDLDPRIKALVPPHLGKNKQGQAAAIAARAAARVAWASPVEQQITPVGGRGARDRPGAQGASLSRTSLSASR
jgi:hypothetical protein